MRREQADLRFKEAVEMGRHRGWKDLHHRHELQHWKVEGRRNTTERVEDLPGRTDITHDHFQELFTDPLQKETPERIW